MSEVGFDDSGNKGEGASTLLAAGFRHRQHRFNKAAAGPLLLTILWASPAVAGGERSSSNKPGIPAIGLLVIGCHPEVGSPPPRNRSTPSIG